MIVERLKQAKTALDMRDIVADVLDDAADPDANSDVAAYEHAITWLVQSLAAMENSGNEFRLQRDGVREAYDSNLKNNIELAKQNKLLAYRLWRYKKKRDDLEALFAMRKEAAFKTKSEKVLLEKLDTYVNYEPLIDDFDEEENNALIERLMKVPVVERMTVTRTPVEPSADA